MSETEKGGRQRNSFTQEEQNEIVSFLVRSKEIVACHRKNAVWKRMSVKFPNHTWQSLKQHFIKKIMPTIKKFEVPDQLRKKMRKNAYTSREDTFLLKYISRNLTPGDAIYGTEFWKLMQDQNFTVIKGRTWQSLKARYLKHLSMCEVRKLNDNESAEEFPTTEDDRHANVDRQRNHGETRITNDARTSLTPQKKRKLYTHHEHE